jgi:hypothetical protein
MTATSPAGEGGAGGGLFVGPVADVSLSGVSFRTDAAKGGAGGPGGASGGAFTPAESGHGGFGVPNGANEAPGHPGTVGHGNFGGGG